MDFFEAQDFFKKMYPNKKISFEFDEKCHHIHELVYTDGLPNVVHHIENNKVKINIEGMPSQYINIKPHRLNYVWSDMKNMINSKNDIYLNDEQVEELNENNVQEFSRITGISPQKLMKKKNLKGSSNV